VFLYVDSALLHRKVIGERLPLISAVKAKRRFLRVGRGTTRAAVLEESQFFWSRPRHKKHARKPEAARRKLIEQYLSVWHS